MLCRFWEEQGVKVPMLDCECEMRVRKAKGKKW